jgi:ABC-type uncharacterized transport system permease subunit
MTRRGSLAYYLAAWVCGSFFMSLTIWLGSESHPIESRSVSLLLYIYFLSLMFGAVMSLLFGFVLRRAANRLHWNQVWHWLAGGAIIAPALTALLGAVASSYALQESGWRNWIFTPLAGPYLINGSHRWMPVLAAPAGAATAWVLFRIDHAFRMPSENKTE